MTPETIDAVGKLGLPVALCLWFVWRDWAREKSGNKRDNDQVSRIRQLEETRLKAQEESTKKMMDLQSQQAHELKALVNRLMEVLDYDTRSRDRLTLQLSKRTCMQDLGSDAFKPTAMEPGHG